MALNVTGVARAAAAIVAALAAPAIAEARRRAKDGTRDRADRDERDRDRDGGRNRRDDDDDDDGGHGGRGIWRRAEAGDGGAARASADGGTITIGSAAYEDADVTVETAAQGGDAEAEAADSGDGTIDAAARGDGGYNYGGSLGNMVDDWRRVQEKRFGRIGDDRGEGAADTGTNIQVDPQTGAIDFDNGNIALIRDDDGSFFVQTGNITFEAGSIGGQGDGGNNDTDFES